MTCPDDDAKVALLDEGGWEDARNDPRVRAIAVGIVQRLVSLEPSKIAPALHKAVKERVRYVGEGIETFQSASQTWELGLGDCDDSARLLAALARSLGLKSEIAILRNKDGEPTHAYTKLWDGKRMAPAECTIDARFGEEPRKALGRLVKEGRAPEPRQDIGAIGILPCSSLLAVRGIEKTDGAFRAGLCSIAVDLDTQPDWISAVMSVESGFSPSIRNPNGGATGLIQFMPSTARHLGTTTDALARMGAVEQLTWVRKYFLPFVGRLDSEQDVYLAVFFPSAMGKGDDNVISSAGEPVYEANKGLDRNQDGQITNKDVGDVVRGVLAAAKTRTPIPVTAEDFAAYKAGSKVPWVAGALLLAMSAAGIYLYHRYG